MTIRLLFYLLILFLFSSKVVIQPCVYACMCGCVSLGHIQIGELLISCYYCTFMLAVLIRVYAKMHNCDLLDFDRIKTRTAKDEHQK